MTSRKGPLSTLLSMIVAVIAVTGVIDSMNMNAPVEAFSSGPVLTTPKLSSATNQNNYYNYNNNNPPSRSSATATITTTTTTAATTTTTTTTLFVSQSNEGNGKGTTQEGGGGEESEEDFQRRMAVVRSLQMSFYGKDAKKEKPTGTAAADLAGTREKRPGSSSSSRHSSGHGTPKLDASTGTIRRLPLFRAAWYELPGRSNVLIIRDPVYTNMFERIFYTRTHEKEKNGDTNDGGRSQDEGANTGNPLNPWVFGHLYTPKEPETKQESQQNQKQQRSSSSSSKQSSDRGHPHELSAWHNTTARATATKSPLSSPAVLGTLVYIRDFRRLRDGRILALVQAAEKFVVEDVRQTLPYAVADVRILPDAEELGLEPPGAELDDDDGNGGSRSDDGDVAVSPSSSVYSSDETDPDERLLVNCLRAGEETAAGPARAGAVLGSVRAYHHYECDPGQRLDGIPDRADLGIVDITHDAISRALPYCRYSNGTDALAARSDAVGSPPPQVQSPSVSPSDSPSLEFELLRRGITRIPPSDRRFSYITEPTYSSSLNSEEDEQQQQHPATTTESPRSWTTEELEYELWLVLDHFSAATKKPVSPILLALLPAEERMPRPWPPGFRLEKMREDLGAERVVGDGSGPLGYPDHRRQRRLSYSAAHLLEGVLPLGGGTAASPTPRGGNGSGGFKTGTFEVDEVQEFRAVLLSVPSTRQRLRVVLETFHRWRLYQEWDEFA